jgi:hypothetical protein
VTTTTIQDVRAKVARWQANLLDNAAHNEREAGRTAKQTADSIRQTARDLRHRARELGTTLAILREHTSASQMTAALEARRGMLRARAEQLPPKRSYGPARRRLCIAADDCADVIRLLREVEP